MYILKCSDDSYYVGHTDDLERRLYEHSNDLYESCYVAARKPFKLVFFDTASSRIEVLEAERRIKKWSRKKKEALISGGWENMKGIWRKN